MENSKPETLNPKPIVFGMFRVCRITCRTPDGNAVCYELEGEANAPEADLLIVQA